MKLQPHKEIYKISMPLSWWLHQIAGIEPGPEFLEGMDTLLKRIRSDAYLDGYNAARKEQKEEKK